MAAARQIVAFLEHGDAKFKVKLISIKAKDLPAIDDEFVKDISEFETLDEYKKDLKEKNRRTCNYYGKKNF